MAHITYNRDTPFGKITADFVDDIIRLRGVGARIKTAMDQMTAGGVTPSNLESGDGAANFGVPTGSGSSFYNDIVSLKSGLDAISAQILGDLDLG